jgi:hypothetical protein
MPYILGVTMHLCPLPHRLLEAVTPESEDIAISTYKLATFYYVNVSGWGTQQLALL